MTSKSHSWFKSYGDFAERVDFAQWWSFIGKGLRLQSAQQACFPGLPDFSPDTDIFKRDTDIFKRDET